MIILRAAPPAAVAPAGYAPVFMLPPGFPLLPCWVAAGAAVVPGPACILSPVLVACVASLKGRTPRQAPPRRWQAGLDCFAEAVAAAG